MKKIYTVFCLDDQKKYLFNAESPLKALEKMRYTLDLENKDANAKIEEYSKTFALEHDNHTYAVLKEM